MRNENQDGQDKHDIDAMLNAVLDGAPPEGLDAAMERQYRWAEVALAQSKSRSKGRWVRSALAAGLGFILAVSGWITFDTLWQPKATWAEVEGQFSEASSFAVTIFNADNGEGRPERTSLWFGAGGHLRIHHGNLVAFLDRSGVATAFDVKSGKRFDLATLSPAESRNFDLPPILGLSRMLMEGASFSLETLLHETFSSIGAPIPALNAEPEVARDLWVFDARGNETSANWMRVWALRESRLPVRVRVWEADDAGAFDMLFDYTDIQPESAFDPDAYAAALKEFGSDANRRFALLQDPAGKPLTPADLHEETGYHMPEVVELGRTAEGVFWVRSQNGKNETPEGHAVYGFGRLSDNLGQEYLHQFLRRRVQDDEVFECFIPLRVGLDVQRPDSITLEAWSQPDNFRDPAYSFGAAQVSEWEDGAPFPEELDNAPTRADALRSVIREWAQREQWGVFDQLLALIPGEPETDSLALFRETQRLKKWALMGRDDDVFALARRLAAAAATASGDGFPWEASTAFREYAIQLVNRGEFTQATELFSPYRAEFQATETGNDRAGYFIADLTRKWAAPDVPADTPARVFGFDPLAIPTIAEKYNAIGGTASAGPDFQPWYAYLETVGQYLDSHPVAGEVTFIQDQVPIPATLITCVAKVPGHPGLLARRFSGDLKQLVREWAMVNARDFNRTAVDPSLVAPLPGAVVVYPENVPALELLQRAADHFGVQFHDTETRRVVWVARYDGRPLPNWRDVRPPDLGGDMINRGGGRGLTARALFRNFEQAINAQGENENGLFIVDETGLPTTPGENQTMGTIALTYEYAFGKTPEAISKVEEWFQENFGITFAEEERIVAMVAVSPMPAR